LKGELEVGESEIIHAASKSMDKMTSGEIDIEV
jgi:hypothetical protein